jgi:hypothetical protein
MRWARRIDFSDTVARTFFVERSRYPASSRVRLHIRGIRFVRFGRDWWLSWVWFWFGRRYHLTVGVRYALSRMERVERGAGELCGLGRPRRQGT